MLKVIGIGLILAGAFIELFEIRLKSPKIQLRKGDISAYITASLFAIGGLILYLAG